MLNDGNKAARLKWAIERISSSLVVDGMLHYVRVDEKWFNMTREKTVVYLLPGEKPPHRTAKSKRFIMKVMSLTALARPRWNDETNTWFDGKIG